ncbi:PH domain-containing protein [Planococcus sp. SIMBA_160]
MKTTYEKVADNYLQDNETLWSLYRLQKNVACVTNLRVFFIEYDASSLSSSVDIPYSQFKAITTKHYSSYKSIISVHSENEVYQMKVESERVDRFINDVLKHKNSSCNPSN